ncbi:MAG: IS256 family transposase [Methanocalculus sp.]|uniref:IS256 family transposase n=1 Tax=Methanocalculus sp. TaxID=2004547 RepID=UPI002722A045|nr:IS256 family transposase [Methanocalculus sp.]MDO9539263.1 IS256 family transposase [Methanocalculus sp.]
MDMYDLAQDYLSDPNGVMQTLLTTFMNMVMRCEAEKQAGAGYYERSEHRTATRNGYSERGLKTRYGEIRLQKPEFREKPFQTILFERYSRVERAVILAITESYINGVSTRKINEVMKHFGITNICPDTVSRMAKELDGVVQEFRNRPIEQPFPYLIVDATYLKVRRGTRVVSQALLITAGIREDGFREILSIDLMDSEGEAFWSDHFEMLKERGLHGVQLVISDGHKGIQNAVKRAFLGSSWQMCHVHLHRIIKSKGIRKSDVKNVVEIVRNGIQGDFQALQNAIQQLEEMGYSGAAASLELFSTDLLNYRAFPEEHWKRLRTTNMLERVNLEIKRRSRSIGAFPNGDSAMRLIGSILIDINEDWLCGKRYLTISSPVDEMAVSPRECSAAVE